MALSMATAIAQVAALVRQVTGMERVYSEADSDENAIPSALSEFPCALVYSGPDTAPYILSTGQHRHSYEVWIDLFQGGGDVGERVSSILPFTDLLIEKFVGNVALGGRVNSCLYRGQDGLAAMEWSGASYTGRRIKLEISEQATATPAFGS